MINADLFNDFLNLVQSRNFSTTARERGMSQSTLSRRIAQLETYVGAQLFDRNMQPVALTEAGEALLPRAQDVLEQMQNIRAIGHPEARRRDDSCSMIALSTLAVHFFPGWLSQHNSQDQWQVNLLNTQPLLEANIRNFLRGKADFLLTFAEDKVPDMLALRHHRYIVLGQDQAVPVSVPDAAGGPRFTLEGSGPVSYCAYTRGSFFQQALADLTGQLGDRLQKVRDNSMAAVLHSMVRQGHGMCWLPGILVRDDLLDGTLVRASGVQYSLPIEIRLYRSHNMGRYAQRFWSCVSQDYQICRKAVPTG